MSRRLRALIVLALLLAAPGASAVDTIEIYESAFEELVGALEPIRFSSPTNGPPRPVRITIDPPFFDPYTITVCAGHWDAHVRNVNFTITAAQMRITGSVSGTYHCVADFPVSGSFTTTANVRYNASQKQLQLTVNPVSAQLTWRANIPGPVGLITFSRTIQVAGGMQVPPIPVRGAAFDFETAEGPARLRLYPYNIQGPYRRNGYIELRGDVLVW